MFWKKITFYTIPIDHKLHFKQISPDIKHSFNQERKRARESIAKRALTLSKRVLSRKKNTEGSNNIQHYISQSQTIVYIVKI